jgi:CubicO group peptidase (beta-lactamase class C family)
MKNGSTYLPDQALLAPRGAPWAYIVLPSPTPFALSRREPTRAELEVVARARVLLNTREAKAIALLDGPNVVYLEYKQPASEDSLFTSASMAKTVTAMAVGQAICSGKLNMSDRAIDIIPELGKSALGNATVKDLLRMASGAADANNDGNSLTGNILTSQNVKDWANGTIDLIEVISEHRVSQAAHGVFSEYKPGERFAYKNTDPITLGLMLNRVTGMSYAEWVQKTIFNPMGAAGTGWISQNKKMQAAAYAGVQLRMEDWIRFAWWVQQASQRTDCFGNFVREASHKQINTGKKNLAGYGYLTWTDVTFAPNTFWAAGWGGQRIGWSYEGNRMVVAFSNVEDWWTELNALFRDWRGAEP